MKRIIYIITLLGGLACCWSACSKDEEEAIEKQKAVTETGITGETEPGENTGEGTTKAYVYSNPVTVAMGEEHGTLKDKLGDRLETTDKLTLTGKIDANDVQTFLNDMPALLAIDMKEVTLVETGATFSRPHHEGISIKKNEISDYMFYATKFQELVLPASVKSIGAHAFQGSDLTSIELPAALTSIGEEAFSGCI